MRHACPARLRPEIAKESRAHTSFIQLLAPQSAIIYAK
jgi:hypothetical protein